MCGIVGYIGNKPCEEVLLHMLSKLDYRGYDSSGIAVKADNNINLLKDTCSVSELTNFIDTYHYGFGIGHTRWATHGKSTKINAHPHFSTNKEFYVVHNGIIENYKELKQTLINNNKTFISETDTEIIPQLLEHYNAYDIHTFIDSINKLTGSYAIATINSKNNHIFLAKNKSPLYISTTDNEMFISSDPLSFSNYNSNFYILEDNEFCDVFDNMCVFYDNKHNVIDKTIHNISLDYNSSNKCNYSTFMEKEIYEIPKVLDNIINNYSDNTYLSQLNNYDIKDIIMVFSALMM